MDLVLKLREVRRLRGLTQKDVARLSGVGAKTISSFETGERIASLRLDQLERLLAVYGLTEVEFFGGTVERAIAPWELDEQELATRRLLDDLRGLSSQAQRNLLAKFQLMVETVAEVYGHDNDGGGRDLEPPGARRANLLSETRLPQAPRDAFRDTQTLRTRGAL